MSSTIKVITNSNGSGDYCIVYETNSGEVVFEGHTIRPADLFNILTEVNGIAEYVKYYQLTDEEMENWEDHIYK